eukprot:1360322-Pyramimonas_sp.AAC.2
MALAPSHWTGLRRALLRLGRCLGAFYVSPDACVLHRVVTRHHWRRCQEVHSLAVSPAEMPS